MKLKNIYYYIIALTFLFPSFVDAQPPEKESGFSLRKLFGISPKTEEVIVNQHIDLINLSEWSDETSRFYSNRSFQPVWFENGELNKHGQELKSVLKSSWKEGLPVPEIYLVKVEEALLNMQKRSAGRISFAEVISDADVKMTQAWFDYASQISSGILDPKDLDIVWQIIPDTVDLVPHLDKAIEQGKITELFTELKPKHEQYDLLIKEFQRLTEVKEQGGWPLPGSFPPLKENDSHSNVIRIKNYLHATGDLEQGDSAYLNSLAYDKKLSSAVEKFQQRHGLEKDGIAGENTLKQMNVPLDFRLNQIRLNIDRIRWLPDDFGENHIIINIPDYSFTFYKNEAEVMNMRVVVGENEHYTPVLEDTLNYIIFNPAWNVPNSIATEELFPKMLEDTAFMKRNNYSILRDSYVSEDTINIKEFDWAEVSRDSFPFFIVQHPGPWNSLGEIQFMLQNKFSIYLHDTPADHLFNVEQRDFSHGCIRLEKPEDLAMELLSEQLPADTLLSYFEDTVKQVVYLEEKNPVHIMYQTAWVENNSLNFREDVYEFDNLSMDFMRTNFPKLAGIMPKTDN